MGVEQAEKLRFIAAAKHARKLSIQQIQNIITKSQAYINFELATRRKEDSNQVTDWIEEILDASMGCKKAHSWTRPTSKAPTLPTHMWKKGKCYSHPHDMGDILLKDWGSIWTQKLGTELTTKMWEKLRQLIITSRKHNSDMENITTEDVIMGHQNDVEWYSGWDRPMVPTPLEAT